MFWAAISVFAFISAQCHIYQTMYAGITEGADPVPQPSVPESGEIPNPIPEPSVQYGEAGGDVLEVDTNEIVFGGDGDDLIDASIGRGSNRLFGRDGNDILLGGFNDIMVGDIGDDALFAGNGGSTLIGSEGADQFWVANGSLPESGNIIRDFTIGTDVIGISGLSDVSDFESLSLVQSGSDTRIIINDFAIAILEGIQADTLTSDSFAFA